MSRSLAEWLDFQQSAHASSIDLELSRVSAVARALGIERPPCPVITVGGTNGKGSVVAHLDAILRRAGYDTGVFTSPHLVRYNERIRVAGVAAPDAALVAAFERIEQRRGHITLTYFEYSTLAALIVFAECRVEFIVLEVGLGGRLDATNIVDAAVAVVCSIGFDHRDWLGDTLEDIGREKAGIFRRGRPAVLGSPDMPASLFAVVEACGAKPIVAERDFNWRIGNTLWDYHGPRLKLENLSPSALPGRIQYRNAATAIAALEALGTIALTARIVDAALREVALPGRFQIIPGPIEWILDVAHNEPAARVLAAQLRERPCNGRTLGVVGILKDKDIAAIGKALAPQIDAWILCTVNDPRGLSAQQLQARLALEDATITLAASVDTGCALAQAAARPGDRVVVCGSFLTVASAILALNPEAASPS